MHNLKKKIEKVIKSFGEASGDDFLVWTFKSDVIHNKIVAKKQNFNKYCSSDT